MIPLTLKRLAFGLALLLLLPPVAGCASRGHKEPAAPETEREARMESERIDPFEQAATVSVPEGSAEPSGLPDGAEGEPSGEETETEPGREPAAGSETSAAASLPPAPDTQARAEPPVEPPSSGEPPPFLAFAAPAPFASAARIEKELFLLINEERVKNGVEALGLEDAMQFAARIRAQEVLESLSHTRPDGAPYHTAFDEAGFSYAGKWHGENLAIVRIQGESPGEEEIARILFNEYIESPGHHSSMLSKNFYQTGVGVYIEEDGEFLSIGAAQLFAGL